VHFRSPSYGHRRISQTRLEKPGGNDFDSTADIGMPVLGRDYNRLGPDKVLATEHTMVGYLPAAWNEAQKTRLHFGHAEWHQLG